MCARLLACPLCSQPGFHNLDALRSGLVSVSTRPLACPICNEVLLGIDKLTIHLFGHTINHGGPVGGGNESAKIAEVHATTVTNSNINSSTWNNLIDNANNNNNINNNNNKNQVTQDGRSLLNNDRIVDNNDPISCKNANDTATSIYLPIDGMNNIRIDMKEGAGTANLGMGNGQIVTSISQSGLFSANLMTSNRTDNRCQLSSSIYQPVTTNTTDVVQTVKIITDTTVLGDANRDNILEHENYGQNNWVETITTQMEQSASSPGMNLPSSPQNTDMLAELVKNAQITGSPFESSSYDATPTTKSDENNDIQQQQQQQEEDGSIRGSITHRCNVCGFQFPNRNILLLHKQLLHQIKASDSNLAPEQFMKNYPCHLCSKVFKMRGSLMVHMRVAHPGVNLQNRDKSLEFSKDSEGCVYKKTERGFECPSCNKAFSKEHHIVQHIKTHDSKQWECEVCNKLFTTKYFLKKHKRLHSGEMPYSCNLCDKTFTFQQSYHKHKLYHKDEKPHSCGTCGRAFKELSTLHNHERIHTGEKPFTCESCGKCFRQRVSYLVHRRIHTGAMPYDCVACGKKFRYKVSQRTHKCHSQEAQNASKSSNESIDVVEINDSSSMEDQSLDNFNVEDSNFTCRDGESSSKRKSNQSKKKQDQSTASDNLIDEDDSAKSEEFIDMWDRELDENLSVKDSDCNENGLPFTRQKNAWNDALGKKKSTGIEIVDNVCMKEFEQSSKSFSNCIWSNDTTNDSAHAQKGKDMFTLSLSPLHKGATSPAADMRSLSLSPVEKNCDDATARIIDYFAPMNNPNAVQVEDTEVEANIISNEDGNLSTLQTINEDSLKELLNSITDK